MKAWFAKSSLSATCRLLSRLTFEKLICSTSFESQFLTSEHWMGAQFVILIFGSVPVPGRSTAKGPLDAPGTAL
jgi:hypothetical protein